MNEQEDFVVQEPYQPTKKEKEAIKELEDKGLVADDWNSGKKYIKSFKINLRKDMYEKQNKLCAFCRVHVPLACVPMHREHIVYKGKHPQWMFLPENLCIACPNCNEFKGTTEVLVDSGASTYPKLGDGFKIIHPLYDKYSDHIELVDGILYRGKTVKGKFTIDTCHLYRVELAEERADQKMYSENKDNIIAKIVHLAAMPETLVDNKEGFIHYVIDIVKKYQELKEC